MWGGGCVVGWWGAGVGVLGCGYCGCDGVLWLCCVLSWVDVLCCGCACCAVLWLWLLCCGCAVWLCFAVAVLCGCVWRVAVLGGG